MSAWSWTVTAGVSLAFVGGAAVVQTGGWGAVAGALVLSVIMNHVWERLP